MARRKHTFEERRAKAARRVEVAKERFAKIEARLKQSARKQDTRRKILLGTFVAHLVRTDPARADILRGWCKADLASFLRPEDTVLFDDLLG
jgi:hypothetical protein